MGLPVVVEATCEPPWGGSPRPVCLGQFARHEALPSLGLVEPMGVWRLVVGAAEQGGNRGHTR